MKQYIDLSQPKHLVSSAAATEEGEELGDVSLHAVNYEQNQDGGRALKNLFYKPCHVPAGPTAEPFLVIASVDIPFTGAICKR